MIYDEEKDEDGFTFLTDKKIEPIDEVPQEEYVPRRRGGYIVDETPKAQETRRVEKVVTKEVVSKGAPKEEDDDSADKFNIIIVIVAIIVVFIAGIVLFNVFKSSDDDTNLPQSNGTSTSQGTTNNTSNNSSSNKPSSNTTTNGSSANTYEAYPLTITSEVYKKGGNFFNNTEKIEGDKAYAEYKQISGLKDKEKEKKINEMLKEVVVKLYDKEYLQDKDTLFVDITTKISVNFGTLSYVAIRTGEDIEGDRVGEKAVSLNIKLDTLDKISFEDLFTSNANIKSMYSDYVKGKVEAFYFTPEKIYVYDSKGKEKEIDISKNFSDIDIYNKYKAVSTMFEKSATTQNKYQVLKTTVSTETTNRDFKKKN